MHWGDYDNDGFLDLAVACMGAPILLFHNNGNSNHWLKVKLTDVASNRSAIGAKVRVQATKNGGGVTSTWWRKTASCVTQSRGACA